MKKHTVTIVIAVLSTVTALGVAWISVSKDSGPRKIIEIEEIIKPDGEIIIHETISG